ncbi:MAG: SGNH/GDSL hydrolase family protein [Clostridia bacterium]|nr:SGNH/GDSL hydrolase family protein [Clostridia bacterium]
MKRIVLLGDSTREGYQDYVKEKLDGMAEVLVPPENCRFALYLLRYVHMWKEEGNWGDDVDLVHWNAGLWDALHVAGQEALTEPEHYASIIRRIDTRLRLLFPKAKVVFATSTPSVESRYTKDVFRINKEVEMYNALAIAALWDTDEVIDDLYAAAKGVPDSYFIDSVHMYTPEGRKLLGDAVVNSICPLLGFEKQDDGSWK